MNGRFCDILRGLIILQEIAPWIGGLGIGSVLTSIIQWKINVNLEDKKRNFNEKKEAYVGLITSLHEAGVKKTEESSKNYALWQSRVELVGSKKVVYFVNQIVQTTPGTPERHTAILGLISTMRKDLGISLEEIEK